MRFPYTVKHNGVLYEPGKDVPIGKEPVKKQAVEDKTASELSKELKDKYGIVMAAQKGKAKLLEALKEAEEKAEEELRAKEEEEELEDLENKEDEEELDNNESDGSEDSEDDDQSFLDSIINE